MNPNESFGAGVVGTLGDLIVGVVREQHLLGIAATTSQPARRGDIHPQVGIAGKADKEGMQLIVVLYQVILLVAKSQVFARNLLIFFGIHCTYDFYFYSLSTRYPLGIHSMLSR